MTDSSGSLNGSAIQRRALATQIDAINTLQGANFASQAFAGATNGTGRREITIYFKEPWRERITSSSVDLDALAWQTGQPHSEPTGAWIWLSLFHWKEWWSRQESNLRPSHCERDALPTELRPHSQAAGQE